MRALFQALAAMLLMTQIASAQEGEEKGRQLAQTMCAHCHAIGKWERSPLAGAPPFRQLEPQVDFDELQERLQEGIVAGHPAMPMFVFSPGEARALVNYLRTIRGP